MSIVKSMLGKTVLALAAIVATTGFASAANWCPPPPCPPRNFVVVGRAQGEPRFLIPTTHGLVDTATPAKVFDNPVDKYYHTYSRRHNYGAFRWI